MEKKQWSIAPYLPVTNVHIYVRTVFETKCISMSKGCIHPSNSWKLWSLSYNLKNIRKIKVNRLMPNSMILGTLKFKQAK